MGKYYEDVVLMEQKFIVNDSINVKVVSVAVYYIEGLFLITFLWFELLFETWD